MPDFRAFHPPLCQPAPFLELSPAESHHLVAVNRAAAGAEVIVFDGDGTEWTCTLEKADRHRAALRVNTTRTTPRPDGALTLVQSLPKGGVMEDIVRHATELGVRAIAPILTARTQVHLDEQRSEKKIEKWQTTAMEAAKQCGTPFLPEIHPVRRLEDWLRSEPLRADTIGLVASLHPGAQSLKRVLADWRDTHGGALPTGAVWAIGPEGDFTAEEIERLIAAGHRPVTLGPLVLRCDTAAISALSLLRHELTP